MMNTAAINNCMNVDETAAASAGAAASAASAATSAANSTAASASASAASTSTAAAVPEFVQLTETRRDIYRAIAAIHDDSYNKLMDRLLKQFECAIREAFDSVQSSPLMCRKLARNVIALTDQVHSLLERRIVDTSTSSVYRQRICFIVAIYIACELCAAQDHVEKERCIIERIGSMLSLYIEDGDLGSGAHKENSLRTLVAIPKVFGQTKIITLFYRRLFPQWSQTSSVFSQAELPDKIYIEYIIIFYCWLRLERDEVTKQRILEFASKFMRPASTLLYNNTYKNYLPEYNESRTATRYILEQLSIQQSCTALRSASRIDNRYLQPTEYILDSDDEKAAAECNLVLVRAMTSAITLTITPLPPPAPDPPDFLKTLCENARRLEPVKRATALYRGIDNGCEVVDLCESDDDMEMFSLDFNVPANVDGSSSNEAPVAIDDDYVPITRIFPSNLRTYQRVTSSAATITLPASISTTASDTYTMPRIVNSYSCRRDSLHLVSTTQTPMPTSTHLVDQCVQTAEQEAEQQQHHQQLPSYDYNNAISSCLLYTDEHCHQPSSQNSHSSDASLHKKQVTFSTQHMGAANSTQFGRSFKAIKPSLKRYKVYNNNKTATPTSSMDHVEKLKRMAHKEHMQASQRMFSKLEANKNCDIRTSSCRRRDRQGLDKQGGSKVAAKPTLAPTTMPMPSTTTQLTPTTSNASSGTPTPQPNRIRSRGPQRSLPTPPASTHSSTDTCRRPKSTDSVQSNIDLVQIQAQFKSYKFNRHKFGDTSMKNVEFYNNLLKLQRKKLRENREAIVVLPQPEPKVKRNKKRNQKRQELNRLRSLNTELREKINTLESNLAIINNYVLLELAKAATPVVRLRRVNVEELTVLLSDVEDNPVASQTVEETNAKHNRTWRRRKGYGWSRKKNIQKRKLARLAAEQSSSANSGAAPGSDTLLTCTETETDLSKAAEPSASVAAATNKGNPIERPAAVANATITNTSRLTPARKRKLLHLAAEQLNSTPVNLAPATVPPTVVAPADSIQTETDLGIAAYVTLAANGERCDDQEAGVKQISQFSSPSPDAEQSSAMVAHEIEVATSNVPVYLLNGESRDVTTPVPATTDASPQSEDT